MLCKIHAICNSHAIFIIVFAHIFAGIFGGIIAHNIDGIFGGIFAITYACIIAGIFTYIFVGKDAQEYIPPTGIYSNRNRFHREE